MIEVSIAVAALMTGYASGWLACKLFVPFDCMSLLQDLRATRDEAEEYAMTASHLRAANERLTEQNAALYEKVTAYRAAFARAKKELIECD